MIEIQVLNKKTVTLPTWKFEKYVVEVPTPNTSFACPIGFDPGTTHLGIAQLYSKDDKDRADLWQISIERNENPVFRIMMVKTILYELFGNPNADPRQYIIIEGASFGNNFRQVELAEQRAASALWFVPMTFYGSKQIKIVPPATIRKAVFGSGKIKAHEAWQLAGIPKNKQPSDALAALSCAYYGMMKGE